VQEWWTYKKVIPHLEQVAFDHIMLDMDISPFAGNKAQAFDLFYIMLHYAETCIETAKEPLTTRQPSKSQFKKRKANYANLADADEPMFSDDGDSDFEGDDSEWFSAAAAQTVGSTAAHRDVTGYEERDAARAAELGADKAHFGDGSKGGGGFQVPWLKGDWECGKCQWHNFASRPVCKRYGCEAPRSKASYTETQVGKGKSQDSKGQLAFKPGKGPGKGDKGKGKGHPAQEPTTEPVVPAEGDGGAPEDGEGESEEALAAKRRKGPAKGNPKGQKDRSPKAKMQRARSEYKKVKKRVARLAQEAGETFDGEVSSGEE